MGNNNEVIFSCQRCSVGKLIFRFQVENILGGLIYKIIEESAKCTNCENQEFIKQGVFTSLFIYSKE